ncbi:hypothetical protein COU61_01115 [Candidatus Pacearchaeota archaeon CG10_big_fil_rev_8_21_14_0_10_35_13]|nr:MAG: hypothetical protein COU61_01115 [Candidatus Pacearchaeota archaeon CG10_big_fil_rev_8_21_14_0_10_35_13]
MGDSDNSLLDGFNPSQKSAILKIKGPCVILAGPGTGKTHTIVGKIDYLINSKIYSPERIVCLTFSNEAVNSLRERLLKKLPKVDVVTEVKEPVVRTIHSFCSDLLRVHGEKIGIKKDFRIILPDDAKILIHKSFGLNANYCHRYVDTLGVAKDLGITPEALEQYINSLNKDNLSLEELESKLEYITLKLFTLHKTESVKEDFFKEERAELKGRKEKLERITSLLRFLRIWRAYEKLKGIKNLQDYSDLNTNALKLLKSFPEISESYDYVVVDEFQDTNKLQCDLLELLAGKHRNITVVGDINQSIYRFRGAYKDNLRLFRKAFSITSGELFALDESFRSTNKILSVAHDLIKNNYSSENLDELFKVSNTSGIMGDNLEVYELLDEKEEVRKVVEIIESVNSGGVPLEEICVVFRTHQQSRLLKHFLEFRGIPFTSVTKKPLLKIPQVRVVIDYLDILNRLSNNQSGGEQSWWDLFYHSKLLKEDIIMISRFIKTCRDSDCLSKSIINNLLRDVSLSESSRILVKVLFSRINFLLPSVSLKVPELISKVFEVIGLTRVLPENDGSTNHELVLVLEKFHSVASEYSDFNAPDVSSFLHHLDIMKSLNIDVNAPDFDKKGVRIMTNHATKGLEYDTVIVSSLAQKLFPVERITSGIIPSELLPEYKDKLSDYTPDESFELVKDYECVSQLLEERRLCYVAFTRAKNRLFMTFSTKYRSRKFLPSQFLNEISYKNNPFISYHNDSSTKYVEPSVIVDKLVSVFDILRSDNPESLIGSSDDANSFVLSRPRTFSPTSLRIFDECQKRFEYQYVYNMPDFGPVSWDAIKLGSFVHLVAERGVLMNYHSLNDFISLAKTLKALDEWGSISLDDAIPLIKVFFERNNDKYDNNSKVEVPLFAELDGIKFFGKADRIDFRPDGLEIIDYKTGASYVVPKYRNWQLGFYALASKALGKPKVLTLDMLKKEKPQEFVLDDNGYAKDINSLRISFNLDDVMNEMLSTAKDILKAYDDGFKPCPVEKGCFFCNEWVWGL